MSAIREKFVDQATEGLVGIDIADLDGISFSNIGAEFPIKTHRCYFNNASIGALSDPVVASINVFLIDVQQNGRNNYPNWCRYADTAIKDRAARLIGVKPTEIAYVKKIALLCL